MIITGRTVSRVTMGLAALLSGFGNVAVAAQSSPEDLRYFLVNISENTVYDSNVARSSAELAAIRGLVLTDVVSTPSVRIESGIPIASASLFLNPTISYDFYSRNAVLNDARIDTTAGITANYARCHEDFTGDYSRYRSDLTDLGAAAVTNIEQHQMISATVNCDKQFGLAPYVSSSENWEENSAPNRQSLNSRTFSINGGLSYRRPVLGDVSLFTTLTSTNYPIPLIGANNSKFYNGYNIYSVGIKYDRHLGAKIQCIISASYNNLISTFATQGFQGFTYSADLTYKVSEKFNLHFLYLRATTPSNLVGASYSIDSSALGEINYNITPKISITIGESHLSRSYNTAPTSFSTFSNEDDLSEYSTISYRLNRRVSVLLNARQEQRNTNAPGFSYSETQVSVTTTGSF